MICPYCNTVNRDDREVCYYCNKDLTMLRLIVNKAKHHYNLAVEHAERNRFYEALTELQNSLDLDKTNANAHVLMGTIYAKQKKFDEAIRQWEAALQMDPSIYKAYTYIPKAKKLEGTIPIFRLLKITFAILAVCILIIGILTFKNLRPNPSEVLLNNALSDYKNNHYGKALEKIEESSKKYPASTFTPLARHLADTIHKEVEERKMEILNHMYASDYLKALKTGSSLERLNPDPGTSQFLKLLRDEAKFALGKYIETQLTEYEKIGTAVASLRQDIDEFAKFFPRDSITIQFQERLRAVRLKDAKVDETLLQRKIENILSFDDITKTLAALEDFNRQYPEFSQKSGVPLKIRSLKQIFITGTLLEAERALEKDDYSLTSSTLARITPQDLSSFPRIAQEYNNLKKTFARRQKDKEGRKAREFLARVESALKQNNLDDLHDLIAQKDSIHLTEKEREHLNRMVKTAREKTAVTSYEDIMAIGIPQTPNDLSEADARKTLSVLPVIQFFLPPDIAHQAKDKLLYLACASHLRLGEAEKAREIFNNLLREFPHSPYLPMAARMLYY
ncbi:MAG: tetratricopeptide repeat protein [Candidatus Sumerlaeota bacterium]|nr:tetratricopeptide repeat protein [Candidatus Sumerlaeota bacterium]